MCQVNDGLVRLKCISPGESWAAPVGHSAWMCCTQSSKEIETVSLSEAPHSVTFMTLNVKCFLSGRPIFQQLSIMK